MLSSSARISSTLEALREGCAGPGAQRCPSLVCISGIFKVQVAFSLSWSHFPVQALEI